MKVHKLSLCLGLGGMLVLLWLGLGKDGVLKNPSGGPSGTLHEKVGK